MTTAEKIANALRPIAPGGRLAEADVTYIDRLATAWDARDKGVQRVSKAGLDLIKAFEGLRLEAYPDPATNGDPWTIGYGSTGPNIQKGLRWTLEQADEALVCDVSRFEEGVAGLTRGYPTTQSEFDALVSFAYNLGLGSLKSSTLLKKHLAGDKTGAANEFKRWNLGGGKVMAGLTRRRAAEANLYRGLA